MTNEQKEKIIRFRRQGFGYADIGRELRFLYKGIIINHNKNRANLH